MRPPKKVLPTEIAEGAISAFILAIVGGAILRLVDWMPSSWIYFGSRLGPTMGITLWVVVTLGVICVSVILASKFARWIVRKCQPGEPN